MGRSEEKEQATGVKAGTTRPAGRTEVIAARLPVAAKKEKQRSPWPASSVSNRQRPIPAITVIAVRTITNLSVRAGILPSVDGVCKSSATGATFPRAAQQRETPRLSSDERPTVILLPRASLGKRFPR